MRRVRLLPIVNFATTSLLVLKLVGLTTGTGSFAIGPETAQAASETPADGADGASTMPAPLEVDPFLEQPVDLAREAEEMKKEQEAAGGAAEAAPETATEPPASVEGGEGGAAEGGQSEVVADSQDVAAPAGEGAPAEGTPGEAPAEGAAAEAPAEGASAQAPAQSASEGGDTNVSTTRPAEYQPPDLTTERAILESLAERRQQLDQRETDIDMRLKLLQAAEDRLNKRLEELKSIESQLGGAPQGAAGEATAEGAAGSAAPEEDEQIKTLVSLYEAMKPAAAAAVFEELEGNTLVSLARAMSPRKLSPIMALMSPAKASKLTVALAGSQGPREVVVRVEDGQANPPSTQSVRGDLPKIMAAPR